MKENRTRLLATILFIVASALAIIMFFTNQYMNSFQTTEIILVTVILFMAAAFLFIIYG